MTILLLFAGLQAFGGSPPETFHILKEDGFAILTEAGDFILLESAP